MTDEISLFDQGFESEKYSDRLKKLAKLLPIRKYESADEEKVYFGLSKYVRDHETVEAWNAVKAALSSHHVDAEGLSFNALFSRAAINIPISTINQLDDESAQAFVDALAPIINLSRAVDVNIGAFEKIAQGYLVGRELADHNDKKSVGYQLTAPFRRSISQVFKEATGRGLCSRLNSALGEKLFTHAGSRPSLDRHDFVTVVISEANMDKLALNPNFDKLEQILSAYREECLSHQTPTPKRAAFASGYSPPALQNPKPE